MKRSGIPYKQTDGIELLRKEKARTSQVVPEETQRTSIISQCLSLSHHHQSPANPSHQ